MHGSVAVKITTRPINDVGRLMCIYFIFRLFLTYSENLGQIDLAQDAAGELLVHLVVEKKYF